ncbi:tyrosine-type recombinase/integrase [Terriglobus aquaticus]|uniref:Tyrosine-type recombinase/integrase n=1 Tax=Terriglobus aquaticus TaxID=940139 RepID=A0ABW9KI10_9BACT|nr:tyrosine-type recombinase/integrase [Terriglobus aquaticus]
MRAAKTFAACKNMLGLFAGRYGSRLVADISRNDILQHMLHLKAKGLSDRTVFNHVARINSLLIGNGTARVLRPADWPRYDEKVVSAYHPDQVAKLLQAATTRQRILFTFFLATSFREQEVTHCTWDDVDFRNKVISARSKPAYKFRLKDKEERSVPVPDSLIKELENLKAGSQSSLLFPSKSGAPNRHHLRELQRLAFHAGLNCNSCVTRGGQRCSSKAVCRRWGLHEFRRTLATSHAEAGVPATTIQRWLGHSDLTTTLRYLAAADLRSDRTRSQVNASFSFLEEPECR